MYKAYIVYVGKEGDSLHKIKSYKTVGAAKGALKRSGHKLWQVREYGADTVKVMTVEEYNKANVNVQVRNCIGGGLVTIRLSDVGSCCDPSTERYHTM